MNKQKVIILSAPSGSGKTTIVKRLLKAIPTLEFSISATTRSKRTGEQYGRDYYFLSIEDFQSKEKQGLFIETEEVYEGLYYGTLQSEVERIWGKGHHVIFDVDVYGGLNIKKQYHENALLIFIKPPSIAELENRLRQRATDTEEVIRLRLDRAEKELSFEDQFDKVVVNDDLAEATRQTIDIVQSFINA